MARIGISTLRGFLLCLVRLQWKGTLPVQNFAAKENELELAVDLDCCDGGIWPCVCFGDCFCLLGFVCARNGNDVFEAEFVGSFDWVGLV